MQTMYYTTRSFIRHEGNVVDLAEYRRKLAACSGCDAAPRTRDEDDFWAAYEDAAFARAREEDLAEEWEEAPAPRRREAFSLSRLPDLCATLAVVVMAVTVIVRFL